MAKRVVLLGVVHGDPLGEVRLLEALRRLRPSVVTLEIAPFSVAYRERHGPRLRALLDRRLAHFGVLDEESPFDWLRRFLDVPFEWTGSDRFARESGAECLCLGDARDAARFLDLLEDEVLSPGNLLRLAFGDLAPDLEAERRRAKLMIEEPERYVFSGDRRDLEARDDRLAAAIRSQFDSLGDPGILAHVAGWEHVVTRPDLPNIARALADLRPERLLV